MRRLILFATIKWRDIKIEWDVWYCLQWRKDGISGLNETFGILCKDKKTGYQDWMRRLIKMNYQELMRRLILFAMIKGCDIKIEWDVWYCLQWWKDGISGLNATFGILCKDKNTGYQYWIRRLIFFAMIKGRDIKI